MSDLIQELEELIQLIDQYLEEERRLIIENRDNIIDSLLINNED